uniref:Uncharacterized protein n=1 Tax=Anguilla anguilla TaxID=7936 RepID=A0A0E9SDT7_ANGAN
MPLGAHHGMGPRSHSETGTPSVWAALLFRGKAHQQSSVNHLDGTQVRNSDCPFPSSEERPCLRMILGQEGRDPAHS